MIAARPSVIAGSPEAYKPPYLQIPTHYLFIFLRQKPPSQLLMMLASEISSPSNLRVALSGITGSISFACWIVLLVPQLIEQWKLKSADGIAIGTVLIWVLGDISNLIGAIWAHLLTPVILLGVWFCFLDTSLLASYGYYTYIFPKSHKVLHVPIGEQTSLLDTNTNTNSNDPENEASINVASAEQPNAQHRRSSHKSAKSRRRSTAQSLAVASSHWSITKQYIFPLVFVSLAGVLGYLASNHNDPAPPQPDHEIKFGPQFFGYLSAACYLGARIPQIVYNHQRKSVYGLSLLFIMFSTFGNLTYALQILFYRSDLAYLKLNASWLIGALGTIAEDFIIFLQFFIYKDTSKDDDVVEVCDEV